MFLQNRISTWIFDCWGYSPPTTNAYIGLRLVFMILQSNQCQGTAQGFLNITVEPWGYHSTCTIIEIQYNIRHSQTCSQDIYVWYEFQEKHVPSPGPTRNSVGFRRVTTTSYPNPAIVIDSRISPLLLIVIVFAEDKTLHTYTESCTITRGIQRLLAPH